MHNLCCRMCDALRAVQSSAVRAPALLLVAPVRPVWLGGPRPIDAMCGAAVPMVCSMCELPCVPFYLCVREE